MLRGLFDHSPLGALQPRTNRPAQSRCDAGGDAAPAGVALFLIIAGLALAACADWVGIIVHGGALWLVP